MKKLTLFCFLFFLAFGATSFSQSNPIPITGTVTDKLDEPLIGVSVRLDGTTTGTLTDIDGKYSINAPENSTLIFSYIGYIPQEVKVGTNTVINVSLEGDNKLLNEVVVVGYGVQKRRDVTGAIASIKPDELKEMPNTNIAQSLQGKLPGLSVTNLGSSAEGDVRIRVRAQNSINADSSPLIVLDGIQFEGFLSEINPNDIESMEVLKDASSAAIYGAKAANGVILITTKRGSDGKTRISFDVNTGFSKLIDVPNMMNGPQFYSFKNERMGTSFFEDQQNQAGVDTDWLKHATQTGVRTEYNLSISGGSNRTTYYVSGNVNRTKGIAINDNFYRYTLRTNLETQITSWLKFGTNSNLGYYDRPGAGANIANALRMNPLTQAYDADGNLLYAPNPTDISVTNPLEPLNHTSEDVARSLMTTNFLHFDFPFLKGLSFRIIGGYNFRSRLIETYMSSANTLVGQQVGGRAIVNNQYKQDWSVENILNYQKEFGVHTLNLTGVYTARENTTKYHDLAGVGFPGDYRSYYQFRDGTTLTPGDTYNQINELGQTIRMNYTYDGRYLLTATARRDGYSAFGEKNKYGIFPSIALGWNIDREDFASDWNWLYTAKLRLSYGETGNRAIDAYATMPSMSSEYFLDNDGNPLVGFYPNKLGDPTLSWETTKQSNAGLDFSLFRGRISGSIDAYMAKTHDLLLYKSIPQINGVNTIRQNIGSTSSNGLEIQLNTVNIDSRDFKWRTNINFSRSRNKILNVGLYDENGNPTDNLGNRWFIGQPINVVYSYEFGGTWQETDDIANSYMPNAKPGDVKVINFNGDSIISTQDMHIIGYRDPDFTVGVMNMLSYKNVTLSFFFNAVKGITRYTEHTNTFFDGKTNIRSRQWWTPDNPINTYPANRDDSNPYGINYFGKYNDASYLRLSDISLAYQFPASMIQPLNIEQLSVFANVKNVITFTNYVGLDPEFTSDYGIPQSRTFIVGLRLGL